EALNIISDAKLLLSKESNQWQNGYPNEEVLRDDISTHSLFGFYEDKELISIMALKKGIDSNYSHIEGRWLTMPNENDLCIHRLAVKASYYSKGIGDAMIKQAIFYAKAHKNRIIRVDTHKNNLAMRHLIMKNGFIYCGIVSLQAYADYDDSLRLAFEHSV
ncbi:MAG: GNAT family N-acetyltransferase, partial [Bacilli bacterium]